MPELGKGTWEFSRQPYSLSAWCHASLRGMYMGLAQPGTLADSLNFHSCFSRMLWVQIRQSDAVFLLCVTLCSLDSEVPFNGTGRVFCSQPGTPPMENYRRQPEGDFPGQFLCGRCECPTWWHSLGFYLFFYLQALHWRGHSAFPGHRVRELQPVSVMELPQLVSVGYL